MLDDFVDITPVVDNQLCLSCGACDPVCPVDVISFSETNSGHIFPQIDYKGCINCSLCLDVCPGVGFSKTLNESIPNDAFVGHVKDVYVGKSNIDEIYRNSQSGGIVTQFVYDSLSRGDVGAVIVAEMQEASESNPRAKGVVIVHKDDLLKTQKSKYVPIPILEVINEIEKLDVEFGIVGVSCQIHGLINLLDKKKKLKKRLKFKLGLICDRVMTYSGLDYLAENANVNGKVTNFVFRDKSVYGYPGHVSISSLDEVKYLPPSSRMRIKDYFTPTRCRMCFDKMNVFADITVGDPHGISGVDRVNGESLVIPRTQLGLSLLNKSILDKSISLKRTEDDYLVGQGIGDKKVRWASFMKYYIDKSYVVPNYTSELMSKLAIENFVTVEKSAKRSDNIFRTDDIEKLISRVKLRIQIRRIVDAFLLVTYKFKKIVFSDGKSDRS